MKVFVCIKLIAVVLVNLEFLESRQDVFSLNVPFLLFNLHWQLVAFVHALWNSILLKHILSVYVVLRQFFEIACD